MKKLLFSITIALFLMYCNNPDTKNQTNRLSENQNQNNSNKLLGAYYFGAGYFTLVPENIRKDLEKMQKLGTDIICIGITENDTHKNVENIEFIIEEAHHRGMKVFGVPSRMAGITAGQPIEPPLFGYHYPHTATLDKHGAPIIRKSHGILSSFYHPEVKEYFITLTSKMITQWKLDGIIWDEPKSTYKGWQDFSELALKNNPDSNYVKYMQDFVKFMSDINTALKNVRPDLTIVFFDEACRNDTVIEQCAKIKHLDFYGTDGKPYPKEKSPHKGNRATKVLPVYGQKYLKAARKNGVKTMMLVENQRLTGKEIDYMEQTLPEIVNYDLDMLIYYYYGFYTNDTERRMNVIRKIISEFK